MTQEKLQVYPAEIKRYNAMGTFGDAKGMLIKQYQFPNTYDKEDKIHMSYNDRCSQHDWEHTQKCYEKYLKSKGPLFLGGWIERASNEEIFNFLKDILKADKNINWTGYRILGTVDMSGYPIFTLELFAKHPKSNTKVYSGDIAPNVLKSKRHEN